MKKITMLLVFLLIFSLVSFGCAGTPDDGTIDDPVDPIEGEDPVAPNDDENIEDNIDEQTIEGTFTGWIDNNSFEVVANDAPYAIRINEDVAMPDDELDGKNVRITYEVNDQGQNIIQSIEVLD